MAYNNISRDDNEDFIGKNTPFNITGMKLNNFNNISLVKTLKNDKLVKNIIKFYSEFIYTTYDNETYFRILKAKDGIKEERSDGAFAEAERSGVRILQ